MRLWRWGAGAVLGAVALLVAGCGLFGPDARLRYRVTVEVQTPHGIKSASSVWQSDADEGSGIPDTALRMRAKGEAVAVDLPGGTLFALMRGSDMGQDYVHYVIGQHLGRAGDPRFKPSEDWRSGVKQIQDSKVAFELYPDEYPLLVRFRDINDPASVEEVHPNLLASPFGPGVHLKRITIAVTDDNVTSGIVERLPWLAGHTGALKRAPRGMPRDKRPISGRLNDGDFRKG